MRVSVALCVLNGARFIEAQLRSIAQQTRVPDEVVIVDDGSTDATLEIVRSVSATSGLNCPIHVNETRLGVEQNFSRAMRRTTGDVIFFCDCDDVWVPEKVAKMAAPFEQHSDVTFVYSDGYIVGPNLESSGLTIFTSSPKKQDLPNGNARPLADRVRQGRSPGIKASTMAFSSKIRDVAGPIPLGVVHDDWAAFWGYAFGQVVAINEPLYYYRRHEQTWGGSATNDLIPGLKKKPRPNLNTEPRDRLVFTQSVYDRMEVLIREMGTTMSFPPRFYDLQLACQEAIRTLSARKAILNTSGKLPRLLKGIGSWVKGDYIAIKGLRAQTRLVLQDIGLLGMIRRRSNAEDV